MEWNMPFSKDYIEKTAVKVVSESIILYIDSDSSKKLKMFDLS